MSNLAVYSSMTVCMHGTYIMRLCYSKLFVFWNKGESTLFLDDAFTDNYNLQIH